MSEQRLLEIPQIGTKAVAGIFAAVGDPCLCSTDSIELLGLPQAGVIAERNGEVVRMW